jgi:cysteine desulfurase/selenocysteine lyase
MIYLDHAATSWPKPPQVIRAMADLLERAGGNPGRSGHRLSVEAGRIVNDAREAIAMLFNAPDPLRVIFTSNATHAINIVLRGMLHPGDRVVTTGMEHNAVMRPLRALAERGVDLEVVRAGPDGLIDLSDLSRALEKPTRLVVVNHASNVIGTIQPVAEIAAVAHRKGAFLLVDAAQSAGVLPIDIQAMGIDLLAFAGHKGLQGPTGTGGLVLSDLFDANAIEPLTRGGTGSHSEFEVQPAFLPDKFESGTLNSVGIAGLGAGVRYVLERGVPAICEHEARLAHALVEGLENIKGVTVCGPRAIERRTAVLSFTVAGRRVSEIGLRLDEEYEILCRVGLHCSPAAHRTIGTFPEGAVRFAPGIGTTLDEIQEAVRAVEKVVKS